MKKQILTIKKKKNVFITTIVTTRPFPSFRRGRNFSVTPVQCKQSMDTVEEIHKVITEFDSSIKAKPKQIECLQSLLAGKDVIANLPVGYGMI